LTGATGAATTESGILHETASNTVFDGTVTTSEAIHAGPSNDPLPSGTIEPSGTEAWSSARELQTEVSDLLPIIQSWREDPENDELGEYVEDTLQEIENLATILWGKLGGRSGEIHDNGVRCRGSSLFGSIFAAAKCIVERIQSIFNPTT
jgi:hypothetical protein